MIAPNTPSNNPERLKALHSYNILDTPSEKDFDDIVQLASAICETPISLISLLDKDRQWFKSRLGLEAQETNIAYSFCAHSLSDSQLLMVHDASKDERFFDNPLVTGHPDIRFYAGVPLIDLNGFQLGTLCVIDRKPKDLSPIQLHSLEVLAQQVVKQLELRKTNIELKQLNIVNKQMMSVLSHDLRSPLNTLQSFLELAENGFLTQEQFNTLIPELKNSVDGTLFMIDNLLEWGATTGQKDFERQPFSLYVLTRKIAKDSKLTFDAKRNAFINNIEEGINLMANKTLIDSVLRNLILNANKFTDQGTITLSAQNLGDWVSISVTDTGMGIPESRLPKLFSFEKRLSTAGTRGEKGSGLGLAISKQFIEAHGGNILLQSKEGEGTSITITLPSAPSSLT